MFLCYFDESGDAGVPPAVGSPTVWFVLNCVLVHESEWLDVLDRLVAMRRQLREDYRIAPRDELKGAHFRNGKGAFSGLGIGRADRMDIYRAIMNAQSAMPLKTFSIAVHKEQAAAKEWEPRYCAWTFAMQRLDRHASQENDYCSVFPDEGHGFFIRQRMRAMRRHNLVPSHFRPTASLSLPIQRVIEDPNDRRSDDSYFVQLADLNAYASHRSSYIHPVRRMQDTLWDELSTPTREARHLAVSRLSGGPPGIVRYP